MPKVWRDENRGITYITTETLLGPQTVCDEHGMLNLDVEMRRCQSEHEAAMLYANIMRATAVMEIRPIEFAAKEHMHESFARKRR